MSISQMLGGIFIAVGLIALFIPVPVQHHGVMIGCSVLLLAAGAILLAVASRRKGKT